MEFQQSDSHVPTSEARHRTPRRSGFYTGCRAGLQVADGRYIFSISSRQISRTRAGSTFGLRFLA